jgi:hypothetical protein
MTITTHTFEWNGIEIKLTHEHKIAGIIEGLQVESIDPPRAKLPISDTGYMSRYIPESAFEEYGSAVSYVRAWLDYEAVKPHWQDYKNTASQYSLF